MSRSMGARRRNSKPSKTVLRISEKVVDKKTGKVRCETRKVPNGTMIFLSADIIPAQMGALGIVAVPAKIQKPGNTCRRVIDRHNRTAYCTQAEYAQLQAAEDEAIKEMESHAD